MFIELVELGVLVKQVLPLALPVKMTRFYLNRLKNFWI